MRDVPLPPGAAAALLADPGPDREALFTEFQPLVRSLVRQYAADPEMGEEIRSEIYCRFCDFLRAYDPARGVPLRPYLVRQIRASIYTYARSHWRRRERETCLESVQETNPALQLPDPAPEWDLHLAVQEVLAVLPQAVATLPPRQRAVVIRRFYEGQAFAEIAEGLRMRPATAGSLLRYALANLRRRVGEGAI